MPETGNATTVRPLGISGLNVRLLIEKRLTYASVRRNEPENGGEKKFHVYDVDG